MSSRWPPGNLARRNIVFGPGDATPFLPFVAGCTVAPNEPIAGRAITAASVRASVYRIHVHEPDLEFVRVSRYDLRLGQEKSL